VEERRDPPVGAGDGIKLGQIAGVPIYLAPSWFLVAILIVVAYSRLVHDWAPGLSGTQSYLVAVVFVLLLFGSVLAHELGHALTSKAVGVPVRSMTLVMLGGYTRMEREAPDPAREFLIALAGPLISTSLAAIGGLAVQPFDRDTVSGQVMWQIMVANLAVAAFNLLPGMPLDGGRLLTALIWKVTNDRTRSLKAAAMAGRGLAGLVMVVSVLMLATNSQAFGGGFFMALVAMFMWFESTRALRGAEISARLPLVKAGELARPTLAAPGYLPLAEALRRVNAAGARGIVVVDSDGSPDAIVSEAAVSATPVERRPWVTLRELARNLEPGLTLRSSLHGVAVIEAMQAHPATEYVVLDEAGKLVGVLAAQDVAAVLAGRPDAPVKAPAKA
jgi:Zn-dependent protease